jgi:limonene-1,2-epoxide hydrolase
MPAEPIDGLPATRAALQSLLDRVDDLRWDIRGIAEAPDGTILYEKPEHHLITGTRVALPCMIALEFTDDLISHWRAYLDIATWTKQQPG